METVLYADALDGSTTVSGIQHTEYVEMTVTRRKAKGQTEPYEFHLPCLDGQLFIDGTEVTLWTKRGQPKLKIGTFEEEVQVGGFEGPDQILTITVRVEAFGLPRTADLYNTPGLNEALADFKTEMNMAMNRATARLKVNLWRIGATIRQSAGQEQHDEVDAPRNSSDRVSQGKRARGPAKGHGNLRR